MILRFFLKCLCVNFFLINLIFSSDNIKEIQQINLGCTNLSNDLNQTVLDYVGYDNWQKGPIIDGHSKAITYLSICSDGSLIASVSVDKTVKIWNKITQKYLNTLELQNCAKAIAFSHDKKYLAILLSNFVISIYDINLQNFLHKQISFKDEIFNITKNLYIKNKNLLTESKNKIKLAAISIKIKRKSDLDNNLDIDDFISKVINDLYHFIQFFYFENNNKTLILSLLGLILIYDLQKLEVKILVNQEALDFQSDRLHKIEISNTRIGRIFNTCIPRQFGLVSSKDNFAILKKDYFIDLLGARILNLISDSEDEEFSKFGFGLLDKINLSHLIIFPAPLLKILNNLFLEINKFIFNQFERFNSNLKEINIAASEFSKNILNDDLLKATATEKAHEYKNQIIKLRIPEIKVFDISPNDKYIAVGFSNGKIQIWENITQSLLPEQQ